MSVTILSPEEIVRLAREPAGPPSKERKSFFSVFESKGCMLNCNLIDRYIKETTFVVGKKNSPEQRLAQRGRRKQSYTSFQEAVQEWFSFEQIKDSSAAGCRSCAVLQDIVAIVFPQCNNRVSYEYSVTPTFGLRRRFKGKSDKIPVRTRRKKVLTEVSDNVEFVQQNQPPGRFVRYVCTSGQGLKDV